MTRMRRRRRPKALSASELAQMGVCERLVVFEHRHGKRRTPDQRAAIRRGLVEHSRFYVNGVRESQKKGRCYIATLVFGVSWETEALRAFRDRILRPYAPGRWLICVYYRFSPAVCMMLKRCPRLQPVVRTSLKPIAWISSVVLCSDPSEDVA